MDNKSKVGVLLVAGTLVGLLLLTPSDRPYTVTGIIVIKPPYPTPTRLGPAGRWTATPTVTPVTPTPYP